MPELIVRAVCKAKEKSFMGVHNARGAANFDFFRFLKAVQNPRIRLTSNSRHHYATLGQQSRFLNVSV